MSFRILHIPTLIYLHDWSYMSNNWTIVDFETRGRAEHCIMRGSLFLNYDKTLVLEDEGFNNTYINREELMIVEVKNQTKELSGGE